MRERRRITGGLSVPEKHQLQIALDTLRNPDKALLGGPSVEEAKEIVRKLRPKSGGESKGKRGRPGMASVVPDDGYADGGVPYTDEEMDIIDRDEGRILEGLPTPPLARDRADETGEPVRDCFGEWHRPHGAAGRNARRAARRIVGLADMDIDISPPPRPARSGPVCPACDGDAEESGTPGRISCFHCGYEGSAAPESMRNR